MLCDDCLKRGQSEVELLGYEAIYRRTMSMKMPQDNPENKEFTYNFFTSRIHRQAVHV